MNTTFTIRLHGLAVPGESGRTSEAPAANPALEAAVSDEALMASICEGDKKALGSLFRRYARLVRGVVYRVLRDTSEADDMVQEIFLLIHRDCQTFDRSKSPARFWIMQMAHCRAISRRRYLTSRHFYTRLDLEDAASQLADPRMSVRQLEDSIDGALTTSAGSIGCERNSLLAHCRASVRYR